MRFVTAATLLVAAAAAAATTGVSAIQSYTLGAHLDCSIVGIDADAVYHLYYELTGLTTPALFSTDVYEVFFKVLNAATHQPFNLPNDITAPTDNTQGGRVEIQHDANGDIFYAQQTAGTSTVKGQLIVDADSAATAGLTCTNSKPNIEFVPIAYPINGIPQLVVNSYTIAQSSYAATVGTTANNPTAPVYSFNVTAETNIDSCYIDPITNLIRVPWRVSGLAVTGVTEKGTVSLLVTNPSGDLISSWSISPTDGMLIGSADRDPAEPSIVLVVQPAGPTQVFGRLDFSANTPNVACIDGITNVMLQVVDYSTIHLANGVTAYHYIPGSADNGLDPLSQLDTTTLHIAAAGTAPTPSAAKRAARTARATQCAARAKALAAKLAEEKAAKEAAAKAAAAGQVIPSAAAAAAVPGADTPCTLTVPANPLTATGLATPYILNGGCKMNGEDQAGFVQGAIISPATGKIQIYNPLVITAGTKPAIAPVVPQLPADAVVGLWFGSNAGLQQLIGPGLAAGNCVTGLNQNGRLSIFGQFAYCNAPAFFKAASTAIDQKKLQVPALGTAADGKPCPTTRDFSVVDQDPSDNVVTKYIITADGTTAINSDANMSKLKAAAKAARKAAPTVLANGSDNGLLNNFIQPALKCTTWKVEDLSAPGTQAAALPLNEIQATMFQRPPEARQPANNPMSKVNGQPNLAKLNLIRVGVGQAAVASLADASTAAFCKNMVGADGAGRILANRARFMAVPGPNPGENLNTFLVNRFAAAVGPDNLKCGALVPRLTNPLAGGAVIKAQSAFQVASALLEGSQQMDNTYVGGTQELMGETVLSDSAIDGSSSASSSSSSSFPLTIVIAVAASGVALLVIAIIAYTVRQKRKANTVIATTQHQFEGKV